MIIYKPNIFPDTQALLRNTKQRPSLLYIKKCVCLRIFLYTELLRRARSCYPEKCIWFESIYQYIQMLSPNSASTWLHRIEAIVLFFSPTSDVHSQVKSISVGVNFALLNCASFSKCNSTVAEREKRGSVFWLYTAECFILILQPESVYSPGSSNRRAKFSFSPWSKWQGAWDAGNQDLWGTVCFMYLININHKCFYSTWVTSLKIQKAHLPAPIGIRTIEAIN